MSNDGTPVDRRPAPDGRVHEIPARKIHPSSTNPRDTFDPDDLRALADSIEASGLLVPLLVEPDPDEPGEFLLVDGERRWRAAQLIPMILLPCIVRSFKAPEDRIEAMLITSLQRADLTPLEEAAAFAALLELGRSQAQVARQVGRSPAHVSKRLALRKLPPVAREALELGTMPLDTAARLAAVPATVAKRILADVDEHGPIRTVEGMLDDHDRTIAREAKRAELVAEWRAKGVAILDEHPAFKGTVWRDAERGETPEAVHVSAGCQVWKYVPKAKRRPAQKKADGAKVDPKEAARRERTARLAEVETARRAHIGEILAGRTVPKISPATALGAAIDLMLLDSNDYCEAHLDGLEDYLGEPAAEHNAKRTPASRERIAAAALLDAVEQSYAVTIGATWQTPKADEIDRAYLAWLTANGYTPDPLELEFAGEPVK